MDFFDVMFGKKYGAVPFSKNYFDTLFAAKLAQLEIKTLTGTLPLTFRTSETALRSWTIYGNNYEHKYSTSGTLPLSFTSQTAGAASDWSISGNDNVGKNKLQVTAQSTTKNAIVINVLDGGIVTANGTNSSSFANMIFEFDRFTTTEEMRLLLSGGAVGGSEQTYYVYAYDHTASARPKEWDGTTQSKSCIDDTMSVEVLLPAGHEISIRFLVRPSQTISNAVFKPMLRLPDTSADFEPYQVGVGKKTKNLFPSAAAETKIVGNLSVTSDGNGSYTINKTGALNEETVVTFDIPEFTIPVSQGQGGSGIIALFNTKMTTGFQIRFYYDDTYLTYYSLSTAANRVITNYETLSGTTINRIGFRMSSTSSTATVTGTVTPMAVADGTEPANFIPYGHAIPITVNSSTQDIYIGSEPLTAGETVSKTSTGVDVAAIAGSNTISTTLYNKPSMAIEGVDYVGVGEPINDSWQIPLAVTCDRNLFNIYGNMAYSGGVHLINYNVETSSVTGEMSADSYYILGIANAIVKGDETFVISFDKSTAGTAELRMTKGTGSSAEIIETFDISEIKSYRIVFECEESFGDVYPWLVATEAATNTFEHIMIKKASDAGGFVPYGAKYEYNVPIDAPLTEGQSVTDTVTISTFEGENVIDTTLTNKPQMTITYKGG